MTNSILTISYGLDPEDLEDTEEGEDTNSEELGGDQARLSDFVIVRQEGIPETSKTAELGDLAAMWSKVVMGETAYLHIFENCPYIALVNGVYVIKLNFFVYPSKMALPYRLSTGIGSLSAGERIKQEKAFDVMFDDTDSVPIGATFVGILKAEMPIFSSEGGRFTPTITMENGYIKTSQPCITVFRATGTIECFRHELTMQFAKGDLAITNITNYVTATWTDEDGKKQETTVDVEIPPCVADMLEACPDGDIPDTPDEAEDRLQVYYNTCTGEVITTRVIEGENG